MNVLLTFVSRSRFAKTASNKVPRQAQGTISPPVYVLHKHVNTCVLPPGGQLKQFIKPLKVGRRGKITCSDLTTSARQGNVIRTRTDRFKLLIFKGVTLGTIYLVNIPQVLSLCFMYVG